MGKQRCERGHYYDPSINRRCPTCGIPGLEVTPSGSISVPVADNPPRSDPQRAAARVSDPLRAGARASSPGVIPIALDFADTRTIAWWDEARIGTNPVVGWLVAIDGPNTGRDFRIYSEGNVIGRDPANKIVIQDESISHYKHAIVYYDPKSEDAAFHIHGGDGHIVYLNDQAIYQPTRLKAYDQITLGNTRLIFVPLCGANFQWTMDKEKARKPAHS